MRKVILIIALLFGILSFGQTTLVVLEKKVDTLSKKQEKTEKRLTELEKKKKFKTHKTTCLQANGPDLLEIKTQIKYGTPLCIEVSGVNTFLTKTFATYSPINFDFSTKGFMDIKFDKKNEDAASAKSGDRSVLLEVKENTNEISFLKSKITFNKILMEKIATDSLSSPKSNETIISLLKTNAELENKIEILEKETDKLLKQNKKLEEEIKFIKNVAEKSELFKEEFVVFQNHFSNIDKYTTLRTILVNQIKKDSVFIGNKEQFINRSKSTFKEIYVSEANHLQKKNLVSSDLLKLGSGYVKLVQIYEQLNSLNKNKELKLSGELKDGDNVLKFKNISASFETKYLFDDEMKKVKVINDSLSQPKNRTKIIVESQAGIDLYDEIINAPFTSKIISKNIYDDNAEITPQLKNSKGKVMHEYPMVKVSSYGNWKVNGSAGYFLNFISDDNYQLRKKIDNDANSKAGVSESNTNALKHSLGGLLHSYYNLEGSVDAGLSVGLSINDDANAGFYLGGSLFFTEKNRLVFTSGVSFIKVNRLNTANLAINTQSSQFDFTNASDTEIKYDEVYKPSFFIGISYNLF